jgi:hypothetical protein
MNAMKCYHMIIERENPLNGKAERKEYISTHQGEAPRGWKCVGVCGYHEELKYRKENDE